MRRGSHPQGRNQWRRKPFAITMKKPSDMSLGFFIVVHKLTLVLLSVITRKSPLS